MLLFVAVVVLFVVSERLYGRLALMLSIYYIARGTVCLGLVIVPSNLQNITAVLRCISVPLVGRSALSVWKLVNTGALCKSADVRDNSELCIAFVCERNGEMGGRRWLLHAAETLLFLSSLLYVCFNKTTNRHASSKYIFNWAV